MGNLDPMLLELFVKELETQVLALRQTLRAIGGGTPGEGDYDELGRSAHSLLGAARIVGVDSIVEVAGRFEDAVQNLAQRKPADASGLLAAISGLCDVLEPLTTLTADGAESALDAAGEELLSFAPLFEGIAAGKSAPQAQAKPAAAAREAEPVDMTMFGLFRAEAESQLGVLSQHLVSLENGGGAQGVIDPLMRAAHSLKGAARLVGVHGVVTVSHAMEEYFSAVLSGKGRVDQRCIDVLLSGVDYIARLARTPDHLVQEWLEGEGAGHDAIAQAVTRLLEDAGPAEPSGDSPQAAQPPQAGIDPALMDLVKAELANHLGALGKIVWEEAKPAQLAQAARSAHALKGTARMVELSPLVEVGAAMEHRLDAASGEARKPGSAIAQALNEVIDLFTSLAALDGAEAPAWMSRNRARAEALAHALRDTPWDAQAQAEPKAAPQPAKAAPAPAREAPAQQRNAAAPVTAAPEAQGEDRFLRVSSDHLDRLMGLSGETQVESRALLRFQSGLSKFRGRMENLFGAVSELVAELEKTALHERQQEAAQTARLLMQELRSGLKQHLEAADGISQRATGIANRFHREVMGSRMRPFSDGVMGFPRMVRDIGRQLGKRVRLVIEGEKTLVDRDILTRLEAPLSHMLRNAVDHGIESTDTRTKLGKNPEGTIRLSARHHAGMLQVTVADDGRGVDLEWLREVIVQRGLATAEMAREMDEQELLEFLYLPNFSTREQVTEISGRGVGMNVVQEAVRALGGILKTSTEKGLSFTVDMHLPISVSVLHALQVEISGEPYAFPLSRILRTLQVNMSDIHENEGRQYVTVGDTHVGLVPAWQVLELERASSREQRLSVVLIGSGDRSYGVIVDRFLGQRDLVVKPIDARFGKVRDVSAAAVLDDGSTALILDVEDLLRSIEILVSGSRIERDRRSQEQADSAQAKRILVVDDSITVREVQRRLLENAGYLVDVAVDGMDGWNAVRTHNYTMVISDIDMPRMNGIQLVQSIKGHPVLKSLPVMIVSYKDREEDRQAGLKAGADYYLTKSSFKDETLLEAVFEMIGEAKV